MTNRTIKHEVKLPKSVIVILGMLAIGLFANAFSPAFSNKEAIAQNFGMENKLNTIALGINNIYRGISGIAACRQ